MHGRALRQSAPQIEAHEKVTGTAHYIADLYHPNMLHGALLPLNVLRLVEQRRQVVKARALVPRD